MQKQSQEETFWTSSTPPRPPSTGFRNCQNMVANSCHCDAAAMQYRTETYSHSKRSCSHVSSEPNFYDLLVLIIAGVPEFFVDYKRPGNCFRETVRKSTTLAWYNQAHQEQESQATWLEPGTVKDHATEQQASCSSIFRRLNVSGVWLVPGTQAFPVVLTEPLQAFKLQPATTEAKINTPKKPSKVDNSRYLVRVDCGQTCP